MSEQILNKGIKMNERKIFAWTYTCHCLACDKTMIFESDDIEVLEKYEKIYNHEMHKHHKGWTVRTKNGKTKTLEEKETYWK